MESDSDMQRRGHLETAVRTAAEIRDECREMSHSPRATDIGKLASELSNLAGIVHLVFNDLLDEARGKLR
jgi:hypothetical protein